MTETHKIDGTIQQHEPPSDFLIYILDVKDRQVLGLDSQEVTRMIDAHGDGHSVSFPMPGDFSIKFVKYKRRKIQRVTLWNTFKNLFRPRTPPNPGPAPTYRAERISSSAPMNAGRSASTRA